MADFAAHGDISTQWRTLDSSEQTRATALLTRASALIRHEVPAVDDRIDAGTLAAEIVKGVAVDMVVRQLRPPVNGQTSVTTDDTTMRWETGRSDDGEQASGLYITDAEVALLAGTRRRARVGTIHVRPTLQP